MEYKPNHVIEEYRQMAAGYDNGSKDCGWSAPVFVQRKLEHHGLLKPKTRIIDFAAGTGLLSESFRSRIGGNSLHIIALDISHDMLQKLRTKRIADVLSAQDITKPWNVKRQSFDLAAATGVGEYLTDRQLRLTIANSAIALKKGGHLAFTYRPDVSNDHGQKLHSPNTVRTIFEKAGFKILEDEPFAAYTSDNGKIINHQYILARKL